MFERLDIAPVARLRPAPLCTPRFVADVHLGTLASHLRLLGFDTQYDNRSTDARLVRRSVTERRILLSRDVGLLKHEVLTHVQCVRATDPARIRETTRRVARCGGCARLYWRGTHFERLARIVADHEKP